MQFRTERLGKVPRQGAQVENIVASAGNRLPPCCGGSQETGLPSSASAASLVVWNKNPSLVRTKQSGIGFGNAC